MSARIVEKSLILAIIVAMFSYGAVAQQSGCTSALTSLIPCLNYITGNSSSPSSSCCSMLSSVVQSSPQCLCSVLNGGGASFGITVNQTQALALPGACNVKTPPLSQCNAANSPATTPAVSPPADGTDDGAISPSGSEVPSGTGGSKTVPSTDSGSSSSGNSIAPLQFMMSFLFIATCVSSLAKF
ncbi:hypothetical protein ACFE04_031386 [Oxalis oulophora]